MYTVTQIPHIMCPYARVNHYMCNVVNKWNTWSVYIRVYNYADPPTGPCPPVRVCVWLLILALVHGAEYPLPIVPINSRDYTAHGTRWTWMNVIASLASRICAQDHVILACVHVLKEWCTIYTPLKYVCTVHDQQEREWHCHVQS